MLESLVSRRRDWWPILRLLLKLVGGESRGLVVPGNTKICIEGYPRSANSFAVRMFLQANDVHVGHHTHAVANVRAALRHGIPVICLIREPLAAICSNLIFSSRQNVAQEIADYYRFYEFTEQKINSVLVAKFETVTRQFDLVIDAINSMHGTEFHNISDHDEAAEAVRKDIEDRFDRSESLTAARDQKIPLPNERRRELKSKWESEVISNRNYELVRNLYDRLVAAAPNLV